MDNGITTGGYVANDMYDRIRWGAGYGAGYGTFASPSSNAVRINRNLDVQREQTRCIELALDQAEESRRFTDAQNARFQAELRTCDKIDSLRRDITDARFEAKDCCCETQKEILRLEASNNERFAILSKDMAVNQGETNAKLAAIDAKLDANKEISELRAQLQTENLLVRTNNGCGVGRVPCDPCPPAR